MKIPWYAVSMVFAIATMVFLVARPAAPKASTAGQELAKQTSQMHELAEGAARLALDVDRTLKSDPLLKARGFDASTTDLVNVANKLAALAQEQQKNIQQLTAPKKEDTDYVKQIGALVTSLATLVTMYIAWRADQRALRELEAKLKKDEAPPATSATPPA